MRIRDDFDARNEGCAIGTITSSYFGWDGKGDSEAAGKLRSTSNTLRQAALRKDFIVELNDLVRAVMHIGATAFATDSEFAGGVGHKKKSYGKSQATSQVNECGNGFMPYNVGCQNTASQIQGDETVVTTGADQTFDG